MTSNLTALAEMWIARYGALAPAELRKWARLPAQNSYAAGLMQRVATTAERLLCERGNARAREREREAAEA
jgi:hypothetical protein